MFCSPWLCSSYSFAGWIGNLVEKKNWPILFLVKATNNETYVGNNFVHHRMNENEYMIELLSFAEPTLVPSKS